MWCGLRLRVGHPPGEVDPIAHEITTPISLRWPGLGKPHRITALVDTGCPVDFVASPELAAMLRQAIRPTRSESLNWGGRVDCEVYPVLAKFDDWERIEIYAPLDARMENLLGAPALMRSNICIRGPSRSVYWAHHDPADDVTRFITRDRHPPGDVYRPASASRRNSGAKRARGPRA